MAAIRNVQQLAEWRLCLGCGACASICPIRGIRLVDYLEEGIRPVVETDQCGDCRDCLEVCPGFETDHSEINERPGAIAELAPICGPVLEIWEGHATDPEIRFRGASGGVLTALGLFAIEQANMHGVLHIGMNPEAPTRNITKFSRSRAELLANAGSRYAPASACDSLHLLEEAPGQSVFIGQPSEVTALRKAERLRPGLQGKVGVALSFFCAGTPARKGTLDLLETLGIEAGQVESLKYRGYGWPGLFSVSRRGQEKPAAEMTYEESWGFIQSYRPLSTHLSPDGTGEDADISCGDPWYRKLRDNEPGLSLIVVRTELGRKLMRNAVAARYITAVPADAGQTNGSQNGLWAKRGAVGGRVFTMRVLGLPVPRLKGFSFLKNWLKLGARDKLRSTLGTVRRVLSRKYYRPLDYTKGPGEDCRVAASTAEVSSK